VAADAHITSIIAAIILFSLVPMIDCVDYDIVAQYGFSGVYCR
jgi:hypothetical protein